MHGHGEAWRVPSQLSSTGDTEMNKLLSGYRGYLLSNERVFYHGFLDVDALGSGRARSSHCNAHI